MPTRREFLAAAAAPLAARAQTAPKRIAAIVTEYRPNSHADVIVGKIIEGFNYDGKHGPNMRLVSMYVDQFPDSDLSRGLAKKYGFKLFDTIEGALTLGGKQLAVEGVLSIGVALVMHHRWIARQHIVHIAPFVKGRAGIHHGVAVE